MPVFVVMVEIGCRCCDGSTLPFRVFVGDDSEQRAKDCALLLNHDAHRLRGMSHACSNLLASWEMQNPRPDEGTRTEDEDQSWFDRYRAEDERIRLHAGMPQAWEHLLGKRLHATLDEYSRADNAHFWAEESELHSE